MKRHIIHVKAECARLLTEQRAWKRIVMALSCVVVFVTTYMLILPAITLERAASVAGTGSVTDSIETHIDLEKDEAEAAAETESVFAAEIGTEYLTGPQTSLGPDYTITTDVPESAFIPQDAFLSVDEIKDEEYELYYAQAVEALGADVMPYARFFNIRFERDTEEGRVEVCPQDAVRITVDTGREAAEGETAVVLHYRDTSADDEAAAYSDGSATDPAEHVGENTGADAGTDDGANHGADTGTDTGANYEAGTGTDAGAKYGTDAGASTGTGPGAETGADTEAHPGSDTQPAVAEPIDGETQEKSAPGLPEILVSENDAATVAFDTDSFSVFGVVYTVDFRFHVNGNEYEYAIPGGGVISFENLIDELGLSDAADSMPEQEGSVGASAEEFTANVAGVEFSSPADMWIGRVDADTSVGALKEEHGLTAAYSGDLSEDEIAEIENRTVKAGDWTLISLNPLTGEECLTVAMNDGEQFSIRVTDSRVIRRSINAGGENYSVTVTYDNLAGIPEDAELSAEEIVGGAEDAGDGYADSRYDEYVSMAEQALGMDEGSSGRVRLFDISILSPDGEKVQPAEGRNVRVRIDLAGEDAESGRVNIVHFADDADTGEIVGNVEITEPDLSEGVVSVSFEASGFSVYAVVDDPQDPYVPQSGFVTTLDELDSNLSEGFILAVGNNTSFFSSALNGSGCLREVTDIEAAAVWYLEKDTQGRYYVYTLINGNRKYIKQASGNNITLADTGTALTVSEAAGGKFYFKHASENRWLQHSNGGGGIRFYTDNNNATNSRITMTIASSLTIPTDPYGLDGKTTGIVNDTEALYCTALMADDSGSVSAEDLPRLSTKGNSDTLYVLPDSDISEWTFHAVEEDKYHITAQVNGEDRYLTIRNGSVVLTDEPEAGSLIRVYPGTGSERGTYSYSVDGYYLALDNTAGARSFYATTDTSQKIWMNFAEKTALSDDDYLIYTAKKINVSDPADKVVLYTRIWNGSRYEFYAVDHDGSLIPCYDDGDVIKWVGNQYETAVWELTDYYDKDEYGNDTVPNGYYELQNTYSGQYLAPRLEGNTLFSDGTVGINLDGRYYQENSTTVKCWDDSYYSYMGMKVDLENNRVVPCPSSQADTFYFARIKEPAINLTEVRTVDNDDYGIKMKMIDFNNEIRNKNGALDPTGRDSVQTEYFGYDSNKAGLLSSDLKDNGYPDATYNGQSLASLFAGDETVDQLFIRSIYEESGYFEFDSTSNYAYLNEYNEFDVYDQLGTVERNGQASMRHGQFMPYNSLINPATGEPWPYSTQVSNTTTVSLEELSEDDPRYGEGLHEIPKSQADYFFGMEMSAQFTQTQSGKDAWGNDIIFEFSGDDDFWFYVDGELILDLGGVHSAMQGSVNFRTGIVKDRTGRETTLRDIITKNYKARNPGWTQADLNEYLLRFFDEGETVFRDFSVHEMKIYYMERGAGSSNLHMRFNLTAVKPGEVTLSKSVTGSDDVDYALMEFPYQILYRTGYGDDYTLLTQDENDPAVTYQGSTRPVKYADHYTPAGDTTEYHNVFFLKAGEIAAIDMPIGTVDYKIVECGVNMNIFNSVKANGTKLSDDSDTGRHDYGIPAATIDDRPKVEYENEVDPDSLRTLTATKVLWDENGFTVVDEGTDDERKEGTKLYGYEDDTRTFGLRISMSAQGSDEPTPVRNKEYFVKDRNMNYCRWSQADQRFVSLGISEYSELTAYLAGLSDEEKATIIFETSPYGGIDKIPAGFSIELRGLPVDSSFLVEERANSIPAGYSLVEYERDKGSYVTHDDLEPNRGQIRANEDPHILVHNQRGWGLTVKKIWSDADYMESHDDIYFAVYVDGELLDGSVRKLVSPVTSLYYYFDELSGEASFDDYEVFEVQLTDPQTDEDGNVTYTGSPVRIEEGEILETGGKPMGDTHQDGLEYEVSYTVGEATGGHENFKNVREDTVTNTRRGIRLVKTDWSGEVLPGAVFTLSDSNGDPVGTGTYTSDEDGLITIAYLKPGEYSLEEVTPPNGFKKPSPWTIVKNNHDELAVTGDEGTFEITEATPEQMAVITFRNKGFSLHAVKTDEDHDDVLLQGAVFALYRQISTVSGLVKDQRPIPGCESLTTGANGVIPHLTSALTPGTYYLSEVTPPAGYKSLPGDLVFVISSEGEVTIPEHVNSADQQSVIIMNNLPDSDVTGWISHTENDGNTDYRITIPDEKSGVPVRIVKTDQEAKPVEGASFTLSGEMLETDIDCESELVTSTIGGEEVTEALVYEDPAMAVGEYSLAETGCPAGYVRLKDPIEVKVENGAGGLTVTATVNGRENPYVRAERIDVNHPEYGWRVTVVNSRGYSLPATGGPGTGMFMFLGGIMIAAGGVLLLLRRHRRYL